MSVWFAVERGQTHTGGRFITDAKDFEPAYLALHRRGELRHRVDAALQSLGNCTVCPRDCCVDRLAVHQTY